LRRWSTLGVSLLLALTAATLPASADSQDDTPAPSIASGELTAELKLPRADGGVNGGGRSDEPHRWHISDGTEKADNKPRRTLREVAEGQRKAVTEAADEPAPAPSASAEKSADVRPLADYDYYTTSECREFDPGDELEQEVRIKNHYAFCLVSRPTYVFYREVLGVRIPVGETSFRITLLGRGERGVQRMRWDMELDDWDGSGIQDANAPLSIGMDCVNYPYASCDELGESAQSTIAAWKFNGYAWATFFTGASEGGHDFIHYDQDRVNYHDMRLSITGAEGTGTFDQSFRCDAAAYASGGGCIYHEVDAVMHYKLTGEGVDSVAAHIKKAQDDPANVYPGGIGTTIPGGKSSGVPLTRLYPKMDGPSQAYYNANNRVVRATCRQYDPNWGTTGMECDEYPFRSTWEGAHYTEKWPNSAQKYSARMVDGDENGLAGTQLGVWYTQDHILAKDAFWVQINP
jgi:hypothetical protein